MSFHNINFDKIPPFSSSVSWYDLGVSNDIYSYFDNNSLVSFKNNNLTAIFIPNLLPISLLEKQTFNSNNLTNFILNLIVYEYENIINPIDFNINEIKQNNSGRKILSTIVVNKNLYLAKKYINILNLSDSLITRLDIKNNIDNSSEYKFSINRPGLFKLQVLAELDNLLFKSNKEYVVIDDFNIEKQFSYQNKKSIYNFSNKNKSIYFNFNNIESDINRIKLDQLVYTQQNNINSLSTQYFWIIFILLLTIEWYLRKKSKLL